MKYLPSANVKCASHMKYRPLADVKYSAAAECDRYCLHRKRKTASDGSCLK